MAQEKISVIVPAYNCEKTIERCLNAICSSTYPNLEVVVVDDGSVDDTAEVVRRFIQNNSCISLVSIRHSGPAKARNVGLEKITGQYFLFADADDFVEPDAIERLYDEAKRTKADIVCGGYRRIVGKQTETILPCVSGFIGLQGTGEQIQRFHALKTENVFGYLWNKLHKTSFFREHQLRLPDEEGLNLEDNLFYIRVWMETPVFYVTDIVVTNYEVRTDSLTHCYDRYYTEKSCKSIKCCYDMLRTKETRKQAMMLVAPFVLRLYCFSLIRNEQYETITWKQWMRCTEVFLQQQAFVKIVNSPLCIPALKTIQDKWQRIGFCLCGKLLQKRMPFLFLAVLRFGYPLVKWYMTKILRIRNG